MTFFKPPDLAMGFPGSSVVKESACQCRRCKGLRFDALKEGDQEDPLKEEMATYTVFLPGEFQEQRSLAGYSQWGHKELDRTE